MLRKILIGTMLLLLMLSAAVSAEATTEVTLLDKTTAMEKIYYGTEQTGSLVERISKLEKDIYGTETKDALMSKVDRIYSYTKENGSMTPSFIVRLNGVEWALNHLVTGQPAKTRLENIERVLMGNTVAGSFDSRLTKLTKLAYADGQVNITKTTINKDTLFKIKVISPLSTKNSRVGDIVSYQAANDIYAGGVLVIAQGACGTGKVTKIEPRKNFGRDAEMQITFDTIEGVDGTVINTVMGEKAKEETKSLAKAAGATVAGMAILGPFGVVGGAFVHGQDIEIPAGTSLFIQASADTDLYGIQVSNTQ
ncbi:MAG: hypothetical protein ABFC57_04020 [Veillonellales bacterium]